MTFDPFLTSPSTVTSIPSILQGPDFPSPYVPLKASDPEEASQAPEGPVQGELQICAEEADPEPEPASGGEQDPGPRLAQVGGSGLRLLSRTGADSGRGALLPRPASSPRPRALGAGAGKEGAPRHLPPLQTKAASQILENGEEAPGSDPSLNCMLSSSSSVSSLNSSTVDTPRRVAPASPSLAVGPNAADPQHVTHDPGLNPPRSPHGPRREP
ncbi:hypothetical protein P7K49_015778 [Saguinus oedipus]|uniref:Uncharacterized protein n=1 Tax=Saguinus oedipus TaxID=9490 RepID=A0ABQ9VA76_SAGOE|nr:hypothetical protein P7K49_015778 [Saguinus oedipus]